MTLQFSLASEIAETAEWPSVALGEIVDILDSRRKPITKRDRVAGPYPYYGATGILDWVEGYIFDEPLVLIGEDGAKWGAGEASAFPVSGKVWVNNHAHVMRPDRESLLDEWLIYYLNAADLSEFISGMTVPKLNQGRLKEIPVPIPPLEQQKRIVALLDQAFAALDRGRANAESNLADAEELFENTLLKVFDKLAPKSRMMTLAEASRDFSRGKSRHRPRNDPSLYGGDYPFVQTGDIRRSRGSVRAFSQTYNENGLAQSKLWPAGTVCITIAANIAETGVLEFDACFPDSVIGMVPDPKTAIPYYAEYMLRYFAEELKAQGQGSAQDNINLGTFEKAVFPFPELEVQYGIVERLDEIAGNVTLLRERYGLQLDDLDDLRQSLLQKAFAGELT